MQGTRIALSVMGPPCGHVLWVSKQTKHLPV